MTMTVADIRGKKVSELMSMIDARRAQRTVLRAMAILGSSERWGADELEALATILNAARIDTDFPAIEDQDEDAIAFWSAIP